MAFKLGVLLVHGMGNQDAGFAAGDSVPPEQ